ncbi:hypothetical protein NEOLEDRAFT_1178924 [Neolentinus lepideus HHB14362 ss-1]|uniref:Uncharacterized protein n=1 Tax=Neolentinus lepideus HHB14362 ss-1 TaxID=1314782 RepID=A0A165S9I1_9AGAM|nr:hypothetical protein NEOLEDRAFT_1178924 [Neolentinus lepideus HHB14362 ss-1]
MSLPTSYRPEPASRASYVAPYLTHVVAHHGQLTLIPPDNAGRMRKARTKKQRSKEDRRKAGESDVSLVLTGAAARLEQNAEPEPVPRPSTRSVEERRQIRHLYDSMAIPDCPPPSFQEAISTAPTFQPFALAENGSSTVLSSRYVTMPSTYSLATTLSPTLPFGPQLSHATPPPSPYAAPEDQEEDYDSGSEAWSGESLPPSQTEWEDDRSLGFTLEQRVKRELERRVASEDDPASPRLRSPPLSPLRSPISPTSERFYGRDDADEQPRPRRNAGVEALRERPGSPTGEAAETRRLAASSVTTLFLSRRVRGDAQQQERSVSPTDDRGDARHAANSSVSNLLSRNRRTETEPLSSLRRPCSPTDEETDIKRTASSSVSNLLSRRLLSKSKKGPSPLKVSSGPHDPSSPLSSPSLFSLSVVIPSRPTSPTAHPGHGITGNTGRAQSPTLTARSVPLARKRRGSIPSLQVFASLKGKRRDHRNSGSSSGETLESWHIVDDDEIPDPDSDTPSLEIDLCAEFPSPPDGIPVPGQPTPPRAQSPTSPILQPASPTSTSGLARIRRAFASASTLNLHLMSKQDLASRPFTGQPTAADDDPPASTSTFTRNRRAPPPPPARDEIQSLSLTPSRPEKGRSPPGSPVSPRYTHFSLPVSPVSSVSQDHSQCIRPGSPVSTHRSQHIRPGSPVSLHHSQFPRSISPTFSDHSQVARPVSPTSPKPRQQVYLPRPASPVSPAPAPAPAPALAPVPTSATVSPTKPKKRPPPPPAPRRAVHAQTASAPKSLNIQTPNNSASASGTSNQVEASTAESSAVTESTESFNSKPFNSASGTDSTSSLPRAFTSDRGPGPDERTAVAGSSIPFDCRGTPDLCGYDREILTPRAAASGLPMQTSSRYIEDVPRQPRSRLPPSVPQRPEPMSPCAGRHHYPGRPLPVPPSARSPVNGGFPVSVSDTGLCKEKQVLLAQAERVEPGGSGPADIFTAPPPSYSAASHGPNRQISLPSTSSRDYPMSPIHSPAVTTHHAVAFPTSPPPVDQGPPTSTEYAPYTDLDVLLSRVENGDSADGSNYEVGDTSFDGHSFQAPTVVPHTQDLLLLSEMVGQANSGQYYRVADEKENMPLLGRIDVDRRRVTKDGRVKLKLSLAGVSVDKCGICLSQFKDAEWAAIGAECQHA